MYALFIPSFLNGNITESKGEKIICVATTLVSIIVFSHIFPYGSTCLASSTAHLAGLLRVRKIRVDIPNSKCFYKLHYVTAYRKLFVKSRHYYFSPLPTKDFFLLDFVTRFRKEHRRLEITLYNRLNLSPKHLHPSYDFPAFPCVCSTPAEPYIPKLAHCIGNVTE